MSNLFSGKNKKNVISLLPAELAQRVVMVKLEEDWPKCLPSGFKGKINSFQYKHSFSFFIYSCLPSRDISQHKPGCLPVLFKRQLPGPGGTTLLFYVSTRNDITRRSHS